MLSQFNKLNYYHFYIGEGISYWPGFIHFGIRCCTGLVVPGSAINRNVLGSIPATFKLFSGEPGILRIHSVLAHLEVWRKRYCYTAITGQSNLGLVT